jgi:3-oxo-5-alpha-steroid 4-dehydrogenase 1
MIPHQTFTLLIIVWIGIALVLFPLLLKITAPYGRHSTTRWGPMINNQLGWFVMELPALAVFLFFILSYADFEKLVIFLASLLWIIHYFQRVVIFPIRIRTRGKKMPVVILILAFLFNLVNGSFNGYWLSHFYSDFNLNVTQLFRVIVGALLFITGFMVNQYHDRILIHLRKENKNGYKIPYGGLFRYVSCPNFLGEILEWSGFAILCWGLPALSFFIWTIVNLVPRAIDHHKWYKKNFIDYPQERKAIIPFIL